MGEYVQTLLDLWFSDKPTCSWCKKLLIPKEKGLCGTCSRIDARIIKYERLSEPYLGQPKHLPNPYLEEVSTAQTMKKDAQRVGRMYGDIHTQDIEGLDLEHIFLKVGEIAVRRDLFKNDASMLARSFSEPQRRLLFALLSRIVREHMRKTRRYRARWTLDEE